MVEIKPTSKQQEFLSSNADVCLMAGGAGSGKSFVLLLDALGLNDPKFGPRYKLPFYSAVIYRKQHKYLNDLIKDSRTLYPLFDPGATFTSTNGVWRFSSGAEIQFMYFEDFLQVEALQGRNLQYIACDELGQYPDDKIFRYCLSRLRSSEGLKPYYRGTSNPSRYLWLKKTFKIDAIGTSSKHAETYTLSDGSVVTKKFQYIQAMLHDNPHLPKEYEAQLMLLPEDERNALLYGRWDAYLTTEAMVYKKEYAQLFNDNRITTVLHQLGHDTYAAFDLGIGDNTSVIVFQICGKEYHILESFENSGVAIDWYVAELKSRGYSDCHIILPHDAGQRSLQTGNTMEEKMKSFFKNITVLPRTGIEDGIQDVRSKFPYIWIDKTKNEPLLQAIMNYERKHNPKTDLYEDPIHNKYSHMADALRYVCVYKVPTKINIDYNKYRSHGGAF